MPRLDDRVLRRRRNSLSEARSPCVMRRRDGRRTADIPPSRMRGRIRLAGTVEGVRLFPHPPRLTRSSASPPRQLRAELARRAGPRGRHGRCGRHALLHNRRPSTASEPCTHKPQRGRTGAGRRRRTRPTPAHHLRIRCLRAALADFRRRRGRGATRCSVPVRPADPDALGETRRHGGLAGAARRRLRPGRQRCWDPAPGSPTPRPGAQPRRWTPQAAAPQPELTTRPLVAAELPEPTLPGTERGLTVA
jgi:hypothetical protein